ncbi:MAG TPA: Fe-S cluster assembly protein SufB [Candidatus Azoamicus sp. OHIO1]
MSSLEKNINNVLDKGYPAGFETEIESDFVPPGVNESVIRLISEKKNEPAFLLNFRLKAYKRWLKMKEPKWGNLSYRSIDYDKMICYSSPKNFKKIQSLSDIDPAILETYKKLGIPLEEQKRLSGIAVAVDVVFDSISIVTTFKEELQKYGVIFCSFSEAVNKYPDLIESYIGSVVSYSDNFFTALNSAVFSDGSFCYIPKNVVCPMDLSTYFRINSSGIGQFERTLIVADENSSVAYLEGCTAPLRDENQLHAAVVEIIAFNNANVKYSTVQNWYPGDKNGIGGVYNFVTKRGLCLGKNSKISWNQVEVGSSITWKYPSVILKGDNSVGEFHSISLTNNYQQADTGTKMIHFGKNTKSVIIAKGISVGHSKNTYRGIVSISPNADGAKNYTRCDSLLFGKNCSAYTIPFIRSRNFRSNIEHEAASNRISEEQLFYCKQRGISEENAVCIIVNGFCKQVISELPMEFLIEAQKLLDLSLEGAVG